MSKRKTFRIRAPLAVRGGIRAQSAYAGPFRVWWSRRWLEALERFRLGARLGRGRSYAASGQVSDLHIEPGKVTARVQGGSKEPYLCEITFSVLPEASYTRVMEKIHSEPMWASRLLVGDLPAEIEVLFEAEHVPLFPRKTNDVASTCSCPDWANPCKHLAAIYCLIGEAIAREPLLLLELRGITRQALIPEHPTLQLHARPQMPSVATAEIPLATTPAEAFYGTPLDPFEHYGEAACSSVPAPLLQRLGPIRFWRGQERFADTLEALYTRAMLRGVAIWTGEQLDYNRKV